MLLALVSHYKINLAVSNRGTARKNTFLNISKNENHANINKTLNK